MSVIKMTELQIYKRVDLNIKTARLFNG